MSSPRVAALPFLNPSAQNSFIAVGDRPGLPIAAIQRVASQCAPISFTAVLSTAGAVPWLYSFRVISATRVKLRTSAAASCTGAPAGTLGAGGVTAGNGAAPAYRGVTPADRYSR